ncbi:MAG: GFA family protein [Rhizobiales bacterium]|nr:GFA family protein [Hyphomicrobiales bacterium]
MIEGGCLCKGVRYRAGAAPLTVRACWCRFCQYIAAGNAAIGLAFPRASVTITGTMSDYATLADSGSHMHRRFCPTCGVHMFSEAEERPHLIFVRAGTLDDPSLVAPTTVIWAAHAPKWVKIDPDCVRFEGQPPPLPECLEHVR